MAILTTSWLLEAWQRRSIAMGWTLPDDWWLPAVDAVTEAVCRGHGVGPACERLGRARARSGVGIGEALTDVGALYSALGVDDPPVMAMRAAAEGWADAGLVSTQGRCEDPLTGLVSLPYLRTRLGELYREADVGGPAPTQTHRLVVVELDAPIDPWRRIAQAIVVGRDLRQAFRGGETLTLLGTCRAAALVREAALRNLTALRRALDGGGRVGVSSLPARYPQAMTLLDRLTSAR